MRRFVYGAFGTFLVLAVAGSVLEIMAWSASAQVRALDDAGPVEDALLIVTSLAVPVVGLLIARKHPAHRVGWLFLAAGVAAGIAQFSYGYGLYGLVAHPGSLPAAPYVYWTGWTGWLIFASMVTLLPLWFPDGRPPGPRWRAVGWLAIAGMVVGSAGMALAPGQLPESALPLDNPLGIDAGANFLPAGRDAGLIMVLAAALAAFGSLVVRFRRADAVQRQQLKWLFWVMGVLVTVVAVNNLITGMKYADNLVLAAITDTVLNLGIPVAVAIAILRHRLYDIDVIIRRSVVYGGLWGLITLGYVAAAAAFGVAATGRLPVEVAIVVTVLITLVLQPLRRRLDALADRLVFGKRRSGYALVSDLGSAMGAIDAPELLAARVASLARQGMDLQWVRVTLSNPDGQPVVATDGEGGAEPELTVPLRYGDEELGTVDCAPAPDRPLSPADREVLNAITTQAALAAHDLRLTAELRQRLHQLRDQTSELAASRARIVQAQEGERRRIEQNLHDGAQQELVALIAKARLARVQLRQTPEEAEATLTELQRDAQLALAGVRELAQGIHPTVLADRGLVEAIKDRSARLPIAVTVHADTSMRDNRFSDAVEGAMFFTISEALANVLKHSGGDSADVRLRWSDHTLTAEIADAGRGFDPGRINSHGLPRLADRIEALGGTLTVRSSPGAGTVVTARLPARPRGSSNVR